MDTSTLLHSIMTVIAFVTFIGIVVWAYSRKRKSAFDEAANAPFALPEEGGGTGCGTIQRAERQS